MLELAVLGLLCEGPAHGYELRRQLTGRLGGLRAISFGSLYPTLRRLQRSGLICEDTHAEPAGPNHHKGWRRSRRVYRLTPEGTHRLTELLSKVGSHCCEDGNFGVHMAFFSQTPADVRLRILESRRRRVEQRREGLLAAIGGDAEHADRYTMELHRIGLDTSEREVGWLDKLIAQERSEADAGDHQQQKGTSKS